MVLLAHHAVRSLTAIEVDIRVSLRRDAEVPLRFIDRPDYFLGIELEIQLNMAVGRHRDGLFDRFHMRMPGEDLICSGGEPIDRECSVPTSLIKIGIID